MIGDPFRDTVTCSVCGFARGTRVRLLCNCRGWIAFWREAIGQIPADPNVRRVVYKELLP